MFESCHPDHTYFENTKNKEMTDRAKGIMNKIKIESLSINEDFAKKVNDALIHFNNENYGLVKTAIDHLIDETLQQQDDKEFLSYFRTLVTCFKGENGSLVNAVTYIMAIISEPGCDKFVKFMTK